MAYRKVMDENTKPLSVMDAIEASLDRTKKTLFRPFDLGKWFALGFCAFLASLGQSGGGYTGGNPFGGGKGDEFEKAVPWVLEHLTLVLTVGAAILLVGLALGILLTWLSSRGEFMFLDGVARNGAEVVEPWHRFRNLGNSLFLFRVILGLIGLGTILLIAGASLFLAWPSLQARSLDARAMGAAVGGACLLVPVALFLGLLKLLLRDFVVPVMFKRGLPALEAFRVFRHDILPGRVLPLVLFYLMALVMGLAAAILVILATCMTCCIAALPYISCVIFLPVLVFFRCYSLYFLEQVGPEWRIIARPEDGPLPQPPPVAISGGTSSPEDPAGSPPSGESPAGSMAIQVGGESPLLSEPQPDTGGGDGALLEEPTHGLDGNDGDHRVSSTDERSSS